MQAIAQAKLDDALLLLHHKRYSNAYYVAGYAVEIALKACISRQIVAETIPDKAFIIDVYKHDIKNLLGLAGLSGDLQSRRKADVAFNANWAIVAQWTPEVRYESVDAYSAEVLLSAIVDANSGVFPWISTHW